MGRPRKNASTPANPRATMGHNGPPADDDAAPQLAVFETADGVIDEGKLAAVLQPLKAQINTASMYKRTATEKMRNHKKDFKATKAEVYAALESVRKSALAEIEKNLEEKPDYVKAKADKVKAAADLRIAKKSAKDAGVDVAALNIALKLAEMDPVERAKHFDNVDFYAKAMRLWGGDDCTEY